MKNPQQNGFVLILVIVVIALIGAMMIILTDSANKIMFQSDTAYLQACERNLVTSGLAWAKRNIKNQSKETFNRTIELDVTSMSISGATLSVNIDIQKDLEAEVQINTSCSRVRRTLRHNEKYRIGPRQ
jgi:type II secretory pathway component PulK